MCHSLINIQEALNTHITHELPRFLTLDVCSETVSFLAAPLADVFCLLCKNWLRLRTEAEPFLQNTQRWVSAPCSIVCIRLALTRVWNRLSTWTGATPRAHLRRFSLEDLHAWLNCWSHDEKSSRADRDQQVGWRTELNSKGLDSFGSRRVRNDWSTMHFFSYKKKKKKKKKAKITGANSVCHHSSMCFLQCAINEGRGTVWY